MNQAKNTLILILLVAAIGLPLWQNQRVEALRLETKELQKRAAEVEPLREKMKRLAEVEQVDPQELKRLRAAQTEALQLRAKVSALASAPARPVSPPSQGASAEGERPNNPLANMEPSVMSNMVEQQLINRLDRMKEKLHLTDEQYAAAKAIIHQQAEDGAKTAAKMFSGKLSAEEMTDSTSGTHNYEEQIKALLNPDQTSAYEQFGKDEMKNQARLAATGEMMMLQGIANLTQEQTTQASEILTEQNLLNLDWAKNHPESAAGDVGKMLREQMEAKAKALEAILEPAQIENFRKTQESQMKLIEAFLPVKPKAPEAPVVVPIPKVVN